jgi:hypothetical protein
MIDGDARAPAPPRSARPATSARPAEPALIVDLHLGPTQVTSDLARAEIHGDLELTFGAAETAAPNDSVTRGFADAIAYDGSIVTDRGDVDIFEHRYQIEHARADFDGTDDPLLDVQLSYRLPDTTMYVGVGGRASDPKLALSADPAICAEDTLFDVLLGAESCSEPGGEVRGAATGAGAAVASSIVGRAVGQFLPWGSDLRLRYVPATSSSSAAYGLAQWIGRHLSLGYLHHVAPLPLVENTNEGELEWWFGRDWLLRGTYGDGGVGDLDVSRAIRW